MQTQTAATAPAAHAPMIAAQVATVVESGATVIVAPTTQPAADAGDVRIFPFSKLVRSKLNVRKKQSSAESLAPLAALIKSQGILQNLIGYMQKKKGKETGKVEIVGGGRRLGALDMLHAVGDISGEYPVRVRIIDEAEAIAASLAENSGREAMHPADQFEAMRVMIDDQGKTIEDVAAAFGVTPVTVKRRLTLAKVSPVLIDLYREDKINTEQVMALALADSHEQQEHVWNSAPEWNRDAHTLRRLITEAEIHAKRNPLARFVTVEEYEAAGGKVRRDLFSDDSGDVYLQDAELLERLALEKLHSFAPTMEAEGWSWVECRTRFDWDDRKAFDKLPIVRRDPTADEQALIDALSADLEKNSEAQENCDDDEQWEKLEAEGQAISEKLDAIEEALEQVRPDGQTVAGVILTVDHDGKLRIERGMIRPEDKRTAKAAASAASGGGEASQESAPAKPVHSERLTRELTAQRTAALQASIAQRYDVALVMVTHQLATRLMYDGYHGESVCKITAQPPFLKGSCENIGESRAAQELESLRKEWKKKLPKKDQLFGWLLKQSHEDVLALFSLCAAFTVDTLQSKEADCKQTRQLAKAVSLDMADWWTPTEENYFAHVPKHRMADAVTQATDAATAQPLHAMKKKDAAAAAEKAVEGKRWVPELFRFA